MSAYHHLEQRAKRVYAASEEMSINVPQVMQKRISMIAQQNPLNNHKEVKEIERMFSEKPIAFLESWQQMALQSLLAQQHIGQLMFVNWWKMAWGQPVLFDQIFYQVNAETLKILEKGLQPISRRVNANVKRLG